MSGKTRTFLLPARRADKAAETGALLDGRYRIVRLLGEGGMGSVYLASHVGLGRDVAIKFLHAELVSRDEVVGRFYREAQAAAAIRHKNIIEVFDVGVSPQGEPFLVMEYLEGESLAGLLKRVGPLNLGAACAVMEPVLQALHAAHRKGIIHRDLKPDNIFLAYQQGEPPVVKIIDFGISKFAQGEFDKWRTKTGSVMGTPAYMSPEQARGSAGLDHRTDIYSMGTILFEMLTGALPFAGSNFAEYLSAMLIDDPRAPQSVCAGFPAEAEPLVRKALAKNPDQRFQNAAEMLEALTALPSFDARQERLTLLASTIEIRGFAAGDLGQALSAPGRLADDKPVSSRFRGAATAVLGAGPWRWVILGLRQQFCGRARPAGLPHRMRRSRLNRRPLCRSHHRLRPVRHPHPRRCRFHRRPRRASRRPRRAPRARPRATKRLRARRRPRRGRGQRLPTSRLRSSRPPESAWTRNCAKAPAAPRCQKISNREIQ